MKAVVNASGYTNVILVLNMRRFIEEGDQEIFESLRGTRQFADVIRNVWAEKCKTGNVFHANQQSHNSISDDEMTTEEVGFATGVFRSPYLEEHTFPTYKVNKDDFPFAEYLMDNLQFAKIFWRAWKKWDIYIRPTSTGMFVIRLLSKYAKPRPTEEIASEVVELQSSLDVKSANLWLSKLPELYSQDPKTLKIKEENVRNLLTWLGVGRDSQDSIKYVPVQWKIAMEVANRFMTEVGNAIPMGENPPVRMRIPVPRLSNPLHDSYVIYHLDELTTTRDHVQRFNVTLSAGNPKQKTMFAHSLNTEVDIHAQDIHDSPLIQQKIVNLIEGSVLLRKGSSQPNKKAFKRIFPTLESKYMQHLLTNNLASWTNEFCLLSARAAVFFPAKNLRTDELLISTLPSATSRVMYIRYWGAIERMVEFILEIRVLAQLIERASYKVLGYFAETMQDARKELLKGDIKIDEKTFISLVTEATNLRRLAALCQGLGNPQTWSRAEYATAKAQFLFDKMGLPILLAQIDRNMNSVNSAVDHLDELKLADLSEDSNNISFVLTLGLAAFSLLLTVLIIPSFWADLGNQVKIPSRILLLVEIVGDFLAVVSLVVAVGTGWIVWKHIKRIREIVSKFLLK